jgi:ABC-type branched-subunit amino acid transport system substrate-binding protein
LALFDKYAVLPPQAASVRVELIPKDTKGTAEGARQAAADAMKEGAELIIGPLFAAEVEAIKPLAQTGKISILSFSNNAQVAGNGVFVMGFDPAEQVRRVAQYTYMQDKNRLAVLAPNDEYGQAVIAATQSAAQMLGRKVEPVVRYSPNAVSVESDVASLIEKGNVGGKLTFDALLLPESGTKLEPILSRLAQVNITPQTVQFIGTGLWDDHELIRKHNLDGAWLASSPPGLYSGFEQRFTNTYDYKPPRIASLAYDAVALAATLATSQGDFSREAITLRSGYSAPANGIFRFRPDGKVERGLAVLRVKNGRFDVLDPAPVSFAD